jgi:hypothetical protein
VAQPPHDKTIAPGLPAKQAEVTIMAAIKSSSEPRYPIIVARINEAWSLNRADLRTVTLRIYLEIRAQSASHFRQLRQAARIAHAALGIAVRQSPKAGRRGTFARPED